MERSPSCIIYNSIPTELEQEKIQSYLALKYGLTKNSADNVGTGGQDERDYFASDGTIIFDYSVNTGFLNDITGIGRDDDGSHNQTTSQNISSSSILQLDNPSGLDDKEFFIVGNNGLSVLALETTDIPTGAPESVDARLLRVWKVEENNGDVGTVDLIFDDASWGTYTISDIVLLIDKNGDGSFADETIAGGGVIGGAVPGSVKFAGVNLLDGEEFTVGTTNSVQTPLPIELLSFDAKWNGEVVDLVWSTASETDNDFFTVERSQDAQGWEVVIVVEGAGNSVSILNYRASDESPFLGVSYYRLKQTDFDGQYSYSQVVGVVINEFEDLETNIYPNPTSSQITLEGIKPELEFRVFNLLGEDITPIVKAINISDTKIIMDLSALSPGLYTLRTKTSSYKLIKQ